MSIHLNFNLFTPLGNWKYGGKVTISGLWPLWEDEQLLKEIAENQNEVQNKVITERWYTLVLAETDEQRADKDYDRFYTHLFPAKAQ
jgi:hypothetical protein